MRRLHHHLNNKYSWYKTWHQHPKHSVFHWAIFLFLSVSLFSLILQTAIRNNTSLQHSLYAADNGDSFEKKDVRGKVSGYAKDRLLIKFKKETGESKKKDILKKYDATEEKEIKGSQVKVIKLPPGKEAKGVASEMKNNEKNNIEFVETDDLINSTSLPIDQYYFEQWYYKTIFAEDAWDYAKAGNIKIGICDSGFDQTHIDLKDSYITELGFNTVDNSSNWGPTTFHGTMVAGIAAASTNNVIGVAGTAWDGLIIPVRISNLESGDAFVSDAAECISYAADNGARVINLSYRMAPYATIDAAAQYAETKDAVTVVAAGNDGIDPQWPDYSSFLAVGATDKTDTKPSWSNYGTYIDLVAPGDWILAPYPPTNKYAFGGGTSFAAPIVSGTLGLMFGAKPSLTPQEAKQIILASSDDLGSSGEDPIYGSGRLNIRKAIEQTLGISITPTGSGSAGVDTTPPTTPTNVRLTVDNPYQISLSWDKATDNVGVKSYDIFRASYCSGFSYTRIAQVTTTTFVNQVAPATCYEYYIRSVDNSGNVSYNSVIVKGQTASVPKRSTPPPTFTPTPITDNIVPSTPTNITATVMSPDNVNISFRGSRDNTGIRYYRIYVPGYPDVNGNTKPSLGQVLDASYKIDESNITYSKVMSGVPLEPRKYWVVALDESGNESSLPNPITISTPGKEGFGNFKGKILDQSGKPLPGDGVTNGVLVAVTLSGTRTVSSVFTKADGTFLIANLPVGTHSLSITYKGYTGVKTTVQINNKESLLRNFTLTK